MKTNWLKWITLVGVGLMMVTLPQDALAKKKKKSSSDTFEPNVSMGQWRVSLPEREVKTITAEVRRTRGDRNTFINARFGRESQTFEGGRRVYLASGDWETVVWQVNQPPYGKELIINAYQGDVFLRKVRVQY